jgi:hypothetical protein
VWLTVLAAETKRLLSIEETFCRHLQNLISDVLGVIAERDAFPALLAGIKAADRYDVGLSPATTERGAAILDHRAHLNSRVELRSEGGLE